MLRYALSGVDTTMFYVKSNNDVMIDILKKKLSNGSVLSEVEKNAIEYVLTEYENIHKQQGYNVEVTMSQSVWKEFLSWKYDRFGNVKHD